MNVSVTITVAIPGIVGASLGLYKVARNADFVAKIQKLAPGFFRDQGRSYRHCQVLEAIYEQFRVTGDWPCLDSISRKLYRELGFDVLPVVAAMSDELVCLASSPGDAVPPPSSELRLTLAGVARCQESGDDTQRFISALRWMVMREADYAPEREMIDCGMPVTANELADLLELKRDSVALRRLIRLLGVEQWGMLEATGSVEDDWTCWVGTGIRRFRSVRTLKDYLSNRDS